jgi:Mg-chelatase subunit ChlD
MTTHALIFDHELPELLAKIAETIRNHPEVAKGPSSRGVLAFLDVLKSYAILRKELTKEHIIDAALITLAHRIQMKSLRTPDELIVEIIEALFCEELAEDYVKDPSICTPSLPLNEGQMGNIMKELQEFTRRKEEFYRQLDHKKSVGFKDKLTQQDFSNLMNIDPEELKKQFPALSDFFRRMKRQVDKTTKDPTLEMLRLLYSVPNYLEKEELLKGQPIQDQKPELGTEFEFTDKAEDLMQGSQTRKSVSENQISRSITEISQGSTSQQISRNMIKDALKSIQNAQDASSKGASFQNLLKHADPSLLDYLKDLLQENLGVTVNLQRDDHRYAAYDALLDILRNLTKEDLIEEEQSRIKITDKGYAILYEDILAEVECAIMKGQHKVRSGKSINGEDVIDIRRYECEDRFRDISLRRTMREVITKRRHPEKIQREDIRIKERRPHGCLDVVLAIDRSSSMIEDNKFQYARKAAIGLALAAFKNGDRSSVVTFANTATKLSKLTYEVYPILDRITEVRPAGYTNLEDGIKNAREILLSASRNAEKHIIVITDGVPTTHNFHESTKQQETIDEKERAKLAALRQVKICRANKISCSVVCILRGGDVDIEFSKKLARAGEGSAHFLKDEKNLLDVVLQDYLEKRQYCVI